MTEFAHIGALASSAEAEAAERLATAHERLIDIAYDCGFCGQATFCQDLKGLKGMNPLKYRQSTWKLAKRG